MYSIGIDIGGMSVKVGLVKDGKIVSVCRKPTERDTKAEILNIKSQIDCVLAETGLTVKDIEGIGIGSPGALNTVKGIIEFFPNVGWNDFPIFDELSKYFDTKYKISNDANVATLAETFYGSAKNYNTVVMYTLGTGVGGGVIIDKKLYECTDGKGTELGHITLVKDGLACTCGRKGCAERYFSATALMNQTKEAMLADPNSKMWEYCGGDINAVSGKTAFECEKLGDESAKKVVENFISYLGDGMISLLNIFRPDAFVIGGGISAQGKNLTDRLKAYCEKYNYGYKNAPKTEILTATLGNDAGILGAAALITEQ